MRWIMLHTTTPSGKTQFVCRCCGAVTTTPDKECITTPRIPTWHRYHGLSCAEIEKRDDPWGAQSDTNPPGCDELASTLLTAFKNATDSSTREERRSARFAAIVGVLQADRKKVADIMLRALHQVLDCADKKTQWDVWFVLDQLREELRKP